MINTTKNRKWVAIWLGVLQIFTGIGAVPAGIAMIIDPSGDSLQMPLEILINSPFADFFIPGIFLLMVNGIGNLIGGWATFLRYRFAGEIAIGLGMFLIIWIVVQVWWMGIHWLHIMYIIIGVLLVVLGFVFRNVISANNKKI